MGCSNPADNLAPVYKAFLEQAKGDKRYET